MKKIWLMIACCGCHLLQAQPGKLAELQQRLEGIDTLVSQVMRDWKVPGIAIGIVYKDQLLYTKGFGYRDLEQQLPVTPHTIFPIASCTKAFTAMLTGMAAEQKLLDINRPVHLYFPELEFYTPQLTAMVTAKDMMTHRTGLPRHDWMTHGKQFPVMDSFIYRIRFLEPSKPIRDEVQYCNLMYVALGELTAKLTGKSWSQQIQEMIFNPLDMKESTTTFADLVKSAEYSKGYVVRNDTLVARTSSTEGPNAAGGINSSVMDMSHWLIAWINNGRYRDSQVLPARFAREAATPQASTPSRPNPAFPAYPDAYFGDMGYGWVIDSYRGHYHVQHSGDLALYSSNTAFYPTDSIGIVVLVNKFNATVPEMISSYLADRLLSLPYKDWNKLLLDLQKKRSAPAGPAATVKDTTKPVMALPLPAYAGTYVHPGYGTIKVIWSGGKLSATHNDQTFLFVPGGKDWFTANVPGGRLTVLTNKKGKIHGLGGAFEEGIADIVFARAGKN